MPKFKTAVAQMNVIPGDVRANKRHMLECIRAARESGVQLIVFPELCVPGYLLGDRFENDAFIREIEAANEDIREASRGLTVVWGSVRADWERIGEDGRVRKYNAALIAHNGYWVRNGTLNGWVPKTNLPKYRIFDDARHFYPAAKLAAEMKLELPELLRPFDLKIGDNAVRLGLAVCEDLWEDEYNTKPAEIYGESGVDLLVDISHSPWTAQKWHARDTMLKKRSIDAHAPILYVNAVGLQSNTKNLVWFDGNSCLIDQEGQFRWRGDQHREGFYVVDLNDLPAPETVRGHTDGIAEIYDAVINAACAYLSAFPKIVIGLSGGIDSAVVAAIVAGALGPQRVLAVNMPTEFNSATTKNLAKLCAENLGIEYQVSPIQDVYEAELRAHEALGLTPTMLVKENIQARARGHRLAGVAAEYGGVFTCNGNKTEVALNYFTLYGDGAGAVALIGDLMKGQVYELARHINERAGREIIPQGIIDIVPSAELSAAQNVDEGKGDPIFYPYHDKLLRAFIEKRWDPQTVMERLLRGTLEHDLGCDAGTIDKYFSSREVFVENLEWAWRGVNTEFKRHQLPPVFITSRRAFGFDRRDTLASAYLTDGYLALREQYVKQAA